MAADRTRTPRFRLLAAVWRHLNGMEDTAPGNVESLAAMHGNLTGAIEGHYEQQLYLAVAAHLRSPDQAALQSAFDFYLKNSAEQDARWRNRADLQ